jgi:hypothetical protein
VPVAPKLSDGYKEFDRDEKASVREKLSTGLKKLARF